MKITIRKCGTCKRDILCLDHAENDCWAGCHNPVNPNYRVAAPRYTGEERTEEIPDHIVAEYVNTIDPNLRRGL